jgi:hypothetical protein
MSYEEKEETDITRNNHSDSIVAIKTTHDDQEEKDETAYEAQSYSIEEDEEESDDDKDDRSNPTKTKTKSKNHIDISEAIAIPSSWANQDLPMSKRRRTLASHSRCEKISSSNFRSNRCTAAP